MKKTVLFMGIVLAGFAAQVRAQFITIDPAHIVTSIINTASEVVQTSSTVSNVVTNWKEVKKVYEQGKEYYDMLKSVNDLVSDAKKVRDAFLLVGEIGDIYINSYGKMLSDPHFRYEELVAISNGYGILLQESSDMLQELKNVINVNTLSMTDHERMNIINYVQDLSQNRPVEAREHVKRFHELFFTLSPDKNAIESNIRRALFLVDRSAFAYYKDLQERGYYNRIISGNINQNLQVDSVSFNFDTYPYKAVTYARQFILRESNITERSLITRCNLINSVRSDNHPHGFTMEAFEVVENRDLRVIDR
jgi:conjugative transposon TraK protein